MATYFSARVSTKEQNLARQIETAKQYRADIDKVFCDKQSGKNFERTEYQNLRSVAVEGEEIIFPELDRMGRNKEEVKSEIRYFQKKGVTLRILDIPTTLCDFGEQDWVRDMITNILVEVLGAMAEQELRKNKMRQRAGIDAMPIVDGKRVSSKTGRATGRPACGVDITDCRVRVESGEMTVTEACAELGISRSSWYRLIA